MILTFKKTILCIIVLISTIFLLSSCNYFSNYNDNDKNSNQKNTLYDSLISYKDIAYKQDSMGSNLKLDIFLPSNQQNNTYPTVLFIHGGSFIRGDKKDVLKATRKNTVPTLLQKGVAVVSLEYTLIDDNHKFPTNIKDVLDCLVWLKENGKNYGLNSEKIALIGTSAGGCLSILSSENLDDRNLISKNLINSSESIYLYKNKLGSKLPTVKCIVDLSAPTKLDKYFEENPIDHIAKLKMYSPINCKFSQDIPILVFHGDADTVVSIKDSEDLVEILKTEKIPFKYHIVKKANHGLIPSDKKTRKEITDLTIDFIENNL